MPTGVTLRPLTSADGLAIQTLGEQTAETGAIGFHSCYHYDAYAALLALDPAMLGVVAEAPDHDGIVGMGMMSLGERWYEGALRPSAYLYSLSVSPAFRRRGVGSAIAEWRVATARARLGRDAVIFAGVQPGNQGSLATAARWSTQRVKDRTMVAVARMRARPPGQVPGLDVRPAEAGELEEIAAGMNAFYADYNFYPPRTGATLEAWLSEAPFGFPIHGYYVAVNDRGHIVAGAGLVEEGRVISSEVQQVALPIRLANLFLRMLPSDGALRRVAVRDLWFLPGHAEAGTYLWESVRWLWRDRGNSQMTFFDPHSPLAQAIHRPRLMPAMGGWLVLAAPVPLRADRCLYLAA